MEITFLIGNGFDLNCGLKTRYKDVYEGYCKTPSDSELIQKFKEDINMDIDNWGDFEVAMADYMKKLNTEQEFLTCLRDFKNYLNQFLKEEEIRVLPAIKNRENEIFNEINSSIYTFHKGVTHNLDRILSGSVSINIILFNYTTIVDRLFDLSIKNRRTDDYINHIHGKLDDDLVLGMDNYDQFKNLPYELSRKGKRAFIKSVFNQQYDTRRVEWAESTINDSDYICVFGMSLGESDLRWRKLLLEWLLSNSKAELFIYKHSCSMLPNMRAEERMDVEEDEKEKLLKSWGIKGADMDYFFNKLHIPCCKIIFNLKPIIDSYFSWQEKGKEMVQKTIAANKKRPKENALL